ncbi:MAG: endonuclease V [Flavobacteriales bacterium]|nr:endonuclease V [Flavobacteriales bacterium]
MGTTLFLDVGYHDDGALAVGLLMDENEEKVYTKNIDSVQDYVPGEFYKRELPCLLEIINQVDLTRLKFIVIDGYVYLDRDKKHGLGMYLHHILNETVPIIGVAKTPYKGSNFAEPVYRGESTNPLFITAVGVDVKVAAAFIKNLAGLYRIPDCLKKLDGLTKTKIEG